MSYDLFFTAAPTEPLAEFAAHFAGRDHFELQSFRARYLNEDTGVYFSFELPSFDLRRDQPNAWASFELNYYRPRMFALEAAIELEAFVGRFGRAVFDTQIKGMGEDGAFTLEGFLSGWDHGNAFARRALGDGEAPPTRPADELKRIWSWNYTRRRLQTTVGDHVFVPKICFFRVGDRVCTGTVWGDGMPIVLPQTDIVVVRREQLARRRWFRWDGGPAVVEWADVIAKLGDVRQDAAPLPHFYADYASTPKHIVEWVQSLELVQGLDPITMDSILDAETSGD